MYTPHFLLSGKKQTPSIMAKDLQIEKESFMQTTGISFKRWQQDRFRCIIYGLNCLNLKKQWKNSRNRGPLKAVGKQAGKGTAIPRRMKPLLCK